MKILLVFLDDHGVALNMLCCLKGNEIHVVGTKKFCPLSFSRRCSYSYMESSTQSSMISKINELCKNRQIEMLIPTDMTSTHLLNNNKDQLSAPVFLTDSEEKINILENKLSFYNFLSQHKISTPPTQLIDSISQVESLENKFPKIVKPLNLYGMMGIKKIRNKDELKTYLLSGIKYSSLPVFTQDYIEGEDIDVSVLCQKGKIITYTIQKWVEHGILEFTKNIQVLDFTKQIIEGLSFTGIAHFDMRIESKTGKVYVIECNPRFWGSIGASYMVGVDFVGIGMQITQGKTISLSTKYKKENYILMGSVVKSFIKFNFKYFSDITLKSIGEMLLDPLPFILTQLETIYRST